MLPEHKERMRREQKEERRKMRPILDAQEIEQIERAISESLRARKILTISIWGEYADTSVRGVVTTIQAYLREIKLSTGKGEWKWIQIEDIIQAKVN